MLKLSKITRKEDSNNLKNYSLMFTGKADLPNTTVNLLSLLNKGDDRFTQSNDTIGYINKATEQGIKAMFGDITLPTEVGDEVDVDINVEGAYFKITESTEIPEYFVLKANGDTKALKEFILKSSKKIKESDDSFSYFISEKGEAIFRTVEVVGNKAEHTLIPLLKNAENKSVKLTESEFLEACVTIKGLPAETVAKATANSL